MSTESKAAGKKKRDTFMRDFLADPEKFRRKWSAEARKEHPEMTDEQLQAAWDQLASQFL